MTLTLAEFGGFSDPMGRINFSFVGIYKHVLVKELLMPTFYGIVEKEASTFFVVGQQLFLEIRLRFPCWRNLLVAFSIFSVHQSNVEIGYFFCMRDEQILSFRSIYGLVMV